MPQNKDLGQHWLFDEAALEQMVAVGEVGNNDTVLEIGPGLGSLTEYLAEAAKRVIAIEADTQLAEGLSVRVSADNLEVVPGDILQLSLEDLPSGYKVVANIPYYLTSKILRFLLESSNPPKLAALLLQKEVAERVTASPGQMSILAFSVQYYAESQVLGYVPKELFDPVPEVDSAILQLKTRSKPLFEADTKALFRLVKAGFGERRKKLANSLSGGLRIDKTEAAELMEQVGINPGARAQELSMQEWEGLYRQYTQVIY